MAVVNNLKEIRESRGLLQEDLASATGFCTKTIGRVERGERAPSAEFMLRLLHTLICLWKMCLSWKSTDISVLFPLRQLIYNHSLCCP